MSEHTAYPLSWPLTWPRTKFPASSPFRHHGQFHSMDRVRRALSDELARLGAKQVVLSTNVELRLDGAPMSNRRRPDDTGAAVYFKLNGKDVVLACDKWNRVECNVWAITKHIEALRGQERWGVGNTDQAFTGYLALAEKTEPSCWDTLGIDRNALDAVEDKRGLIMSQYRIKALKAHPDHGGNAVDFDRVCKAKDIALASIK